MRKNTGLINSIPNNIRRFFWWSAGAVSSILEECPTEQAKFSSVGILIVFISILASISFAFFLTMTFEMSFQNALPYGFIWGAMIFCLDRVLLTSYRKGETSKISIIQRFILTIAIAILIGEPMLLFFFRSEINLKLAQESVSVVAQSRRDIEEKYKPRIDAINHENEVIQNKLTELEKIRNEKQNDYNAEVAGTNGSGLSGLKGSGIVSDTKLGFLRKAQDDLDKYQQSTVQTLENNKNSLAKIQQDIESEVKKIEETSTQANGVLARHKALFSIIRENAGAAAVYIPLFLILMLLETLPLSLKIFSRKSIYDVRLASKETQQITEISKNEIYESNQKEFLWDALEKLEAKLYQAVFDGKIDKLSDPDLRILAKDIKTDILLTIKERSIRHQLSTFDEAEFGDEILIEVIGDNSYEFVCQIPQNNRRQFSIQTLSADINRIGHKISESLGEKVAFAKAFSSRMKEISTNLPLLVQLENDRKLILEFETIGETI